MTHCSPAQENKHDLISRKLGLRPGMRHLDIGCGWGSMVLHAARHYGVQSVGVTISRAQAERARKRVADAGLARPDRDSHSGTIGTSTTVLSTPSAPSGWLNTSAGQTNFAPTSHRCGVFLPRTVDSSTMPLDVRRISNPPAPSGFIQRYVFPDGELHELGAMITAMQESGFEARHMETLRLHYARTLRAWVSNLEASWDEAVAEVGLGRAMVWRLYMAGSAVAFERGEIEIHQVLAMPHGADRNAIPLRPDW